MFRPPTKYSEYLQDVRKSIDYILKRVNSKYVSQIVAGSNVTISPADGTGVVTINAAASGGGVTQIVAGTNVTISPIGGTGVVTINATGGGGGLATPTGYGSFYSNVTQTLAAINTPQAVTLGSTYEANGTSTSGSRIYLDNAGTYQFSYVAQVSNLANSVEYAEFWIKYNGVTYPNSGTRITLAPRKSSTEPSEQLMSLILNGTSISDNDYIELFWEATSNQVSLQYQPATIDYPATPSIIANIVPVGSAPDSSVGSKLYLFYNI
jgi:hypothetical protein